MILAPTLTLSAGSGAAIVRPTFSRDFAGEKTLNNGTGPAITFTRASNATFFDASGVLQTASNDAPRFDHSGGSSLGLLIEEARTNLFLNSATLTTQSVTVTAVAHTLSFYGTGQIVLSGAHSATVAGSGAFPTRTTLTFTPSAGSLTATVSGTIEYAQLEAGAFATSYITTTGATATRSADVAAVDPINSFYNQTEGTLFIECSFLGLRSDGGTSSVIHVQDKGTVNDNFARLRQGAVIAGADYQIRVGAVTTVDSNSLTVVAGTTYRHAFTIKQDDFAAYRNASDLLTDSSVTIPSVNWLGIYTAVSGDVSSGHIRRIAYYPKRLTNTLLQQLTT
jgi:hypothetical protein